MPAVAVALLLVFVSALNGQETRPKPPWDEAYTLGVEADDNADYDAAEKALTEACQIAFDSGDAAGLELVCSKLARTYAVQSRYKQAEQAFVELVARLEAIPGVHPNLVVRARLALANVRSARADFAGATDAARGIGPYMPRLRASDQVEAYVKLAQFFLPVDRQASGGDMLRSARTASEKSEAFDDFRHVRAAGRLANALEGSNRLQDAEEVLAPFVEEARKRFGSGEPMESELRSAYLRVASDYSSVLRAKGRPEDAKRFAEEAAVWRKSQATPSRRDTVGPSSTDKVYTVGGPVAAPKLLKKVNPHMTDGALQNRAQGKVVLSLQVWPDGRAHRITVLRPLPYGLHWEAIGAARKWRFQPGTMNGEPVKISAAIEVDFAFRNP